MSSLTLIPYTGPRRSRPAVGISRRQVAAVKPSLHAYGVAHGVIGVVQVPYVPGRDGARYLYRQEPVYVHFVERAHDGADRTQAVEFGAYLVEIIGRQLVQVVPPVHGIYVRLAVPPELVPVYAETYAVRQHVVFVVRRVQHDFDVFPLPAGFLRTYLLDYRVVHFPVRVRYVQRVAYIAYDGDVPAYVIRVKMSHLPEADPGHEFRRIECLPVVRAVVRRDAGQVDRPYPVGFQQYGVAFVARPVRYARRVIPEFFRERSQAVFQLPLRIVVTVRQGGRQPAANLAVEHGGARRLVPEIRHAVAKLDVPFATETVTTAILFCYISGNQPAHHVRADRVHHLVQSHLYACFFIYYVKNNI